MSRVEVRDLRNIREAGVELSPGLNVLEGRNAQGKTSVLEAVALLARGRSFRTERIETLIRRGCAALGARGRVEDARRRPVSLEVRVERGHRRLSADGLTLGAAAYGGRLEVVVYSTDRLRVVSGPMRERRAYLDRSAAALWPAYRQLLRDYERVVRQRNAALQAGRSDLVAWDDRLIELGGRLRHRRGRYVGQLRTGLANGYRPLAEVYDLQLAPGPAGSEEAEKARLSEELAERRRDERRAGRSLAGPHRDQVQLSVDGEEAAESASSGQARSLLLALTLATLAVYARESGSTPVALLDDLDSELDEERAQALCREVAARGQALVTTAHAGWARSLAPLGRLFHVERGEVRAA